MNVAEAMAYEASTLSEPDTDARQGGGYGRAFYNQAFDAKHPAENIMPQASPVKLNGFFSDMRPMHQQPGSMTPPLTPTRAAQALRAAPAQGLRVQMPADAGAYAFPTTPSGRRRANDTVSTTPVQAFANVTWDEDQDPAIVAMPKATYQEARANHGAVATGLAGQPLSREAREARMRAWEAEVAQLIAAECRLEAINKVGPSDGGMVRCYVRRKKSLLGKQATFTLFLENSDIFLMAARRRQKAKNSNYLLCLDKEDMTRGADATIAKLKSNFVGTEFNVWGKGRDPHVKKGYGSQDACIQFVPNPLLKSGPRMMFVAVPVPEAHWQPTALEGGPDSLSHCLTSARERALTPQLERNILVMSNRPPEYDEGKKAYTLDFGGRVKAASVKNFQLVAYDHNRDQRGTDVILQFGKVNSDVFSMDFKYPLCAKTALSIALASIDEKLCYTV